MPSYRPLYGVTIFLSAFLLFVVEPIAAKQLLPILGGSSAVWLTCLVFFQTTLLLGYLYAHWLSRSSLTPKLHHLHLALLALAIVILAAAAFFHSSFAHATTHPVATIFATLSLTIGVPFLLLASSSPLLQVWLSRSENGRVPFRLFALSNAGSLLALAAYPTLLEPYLSLKLQRTLWALGFVAYAILCAILSRRARDLKQQQEPDQSGEAVVASSVNKLLWFFLPMVAAMQLSAVTSHLSMNIAAIPLLWILPLATYLLTFIIAFEYPAFYRRSIIVRLLVLLLASLGYALSKTDVSLPIALSIGFFLLECFIACLFCHAEVFALRPRRVSETTLFYLLIASGGAAGTFFIGIASPLIFSANYDLAISFFLTAVLALIVTWSDGWGLRLLWTTGSVLLFALLLMLHTVYARQTMLQVRNFYGTLRVKKSNSPPEGAPARMLLNGTIQHGIQLFAPGMNKTPTTYYGENSGIGLTFLHCCNGRARNIGVVGLGAGTLAAYGTAGDHIRFYEINPAVRPIAENLFTFLRDSPAQITFSEGDARASLAREAPQNFDVLVVDAFSGDAIPLHLLTTQAIALYRRHLAANGILAFHVSNQYVDLAPEIALLAASANMQSRSVDSPSVEHIGVYKSTWVLVSNDASFFNREEIAPQALPIPPNPGLRPWTDDYSSLLPILRFETNWTR